MSKISNLSGALLPEQTEQLKKIFATFDADGSGEVDCKEIVAVMKKRGLDTTEDEIGKMIDEVDADGNRELSYDEFVKMMQDKSSIGWSKVMALELFGVLPKMDIFEHVKDEDFFRALIRSMQLKRFKQGEPVCHFGDMSSSMYVVTTGQLDVAYHDGRPPRVLNHGEIFGEQAVLAQGKRTEDVTARVDSDCFVLDEEAFVKTLSDFPDYRSGVYKAGLKYQPEFVQSQLRAFTAWANFRISSRNTEFVWHNLNGLECIVLVEELTGVKITGYQKTPKSRIHMQGNVAHALAALEKQNVVIHGVDAGHLVDGTLKTILAFLWALILNFEVAGTKGGNEKNARSALKDWVASVVGHEVKLGLETAFADGKLLPELLNALQPNSVTTKAGDPAKALEACFMAGAAKFGIPEMLNAAMTAAKKEDVHSICAYISQYRKWAAAHPAGAAMEAAPAKKAEAKKEAPKKEEKAKAPAAKAPAAKAPAAKASKKGGKGKFGAASDADLFKEVAPLLDAYKTWGKLGYAFQQKNGGVSWAAGLKNSKGPLPKFLYKNSKTYQASYPTWQAFHAAYKS